MNALPRLINRRRTGAALIIALVFVLIFSTLAVSMAAMSGTGVQLADNQRRGANARVAAESGQQIIRHWLSNVGISGTTALNMTYSQVAADFQAETYGLSNVYPTYNWYHIYVPTVSLATDGTQTFSATMTPLPATLSPTMIRVDVRGTSNGLSKTIRSDYVLGERANTVFNFGVASKGPIDLSGNIELSGVTVSIESNVYIESEDNLLALSITGNSQIAGDVSIANPLASVDLQGGQASIGGDTGQAAIDNHVKFGVPSSEFPEPVPSYFEKYVQNIIDCNSDFSAGVTYDNCKVMPGTNPNFGSNATIRGVLYVEVPNVVTFTGNANVTGIIVGNGDITDNSGTNQINFAGTVNSQPLSSLPDDPNFAELKTEVGTFIIAPGFKLTFGGNFNTLNGAIAANGIAFQGNAGGTIAGSAINYSNDVMQISGDSDLYFNRSGITDAPPGFVPQIVLLYDPTSYDELPN